MSAPANASIATADAEMDAVFSSFMPTFTALGPRRTDTLRVALVNGVGSEEGTEATKRLAADLTSLGYAVQVFRPRRRGEVEAPDTSARYREFPLPALPLPGHFQRVWQEYNVDAVHILGAGAFGLVAALGARQCAQPVSFAPSMDDVARRPFWHRALCSLVDELIATELSQAQRLRALGSRVRVVPEGIDLQEYSPRQRSLSLRHQWGVRADVPVLAHVGPVHDMATASQLREAMDALLKFAPDARLLLIQAGRIPASLLALRPLRGEEWRHRPLGWPGSERETSLAAQLASADLLLVSSSDGHPSLIPQALACGLAVIARNDERSHLHLEDGHNGFLVGKENGELAEGAFGEAVCDALSSSPALTKLRLRAPASMAHLERRRTADQLASNLADMARNHARRRLTADAWIIPVADF